MCAGEGATTTSMVDLISAALVPLTAVPLVASGGDDDGMKSSDWAKVDDVLLIRLLCLRDGVRGVAFAIVAKRDERVMSDSSE